MSDSESDLKMSHSKSDLKMSDSKFDLKMSDSEPDLKMSDDNKCFLCLAEMSSVKCPQACGAVACSWSHLQVHLSEATNGQVTSGVVTTRGIIETNGVIATNGTIATNGIIATNGHTYITGLIEAHGLNETKSLITTNGLMETNGLIETESLIVTNGHTSRNGLIEDKGQMKTSQCRPFKVDISETFGRHLVATRNILPLEEILFEKVAVLGPATKTVPVCLECLQPSCEGNFKSKVFFNI